MLVLSVVNIFSMPLFWRWLGTDMYALWSYVIFFTGMFGFADMGLAVAVNDAGGAVRLGAGSVAAAAGPADSTMAIGARNTTRMRALRARTARCCMGRDRLGRRITGELAYSISVQDGPT